MITAKSRKAQIEYEISQNIHIDSNDLTVEQFLYDFIEKYGEKRWAASTYDGNVGLMENYVFPYLGDKKFSVSKPQQTRELISGISEYFNNSGDKGTLYLGYPLTANSDSKVTICKANLKILQ